MAEKINKEIVYIIPGHGMGASSAPMRKLADAIRNSGYSVIFFNPNWKALLIPQLPERIPNNAIIVGFSIGAVLGYLIAKQHGCKKLVLASCTLTQKYPQSLWIKEVFSHFSKDKALACAKEITSIKIQLNKLGMPVIVLAGEKERAKVLKADVLVPKTDHVMNKAYINAIVKVL